MRIYKMYSGISTMELRKEKAGAINALQRAAEDTEEAMLEADRLEGENESMKAAIKRYRLMIDNFEEEYAAMKKGEGEGALRGAGQVRQRMSARPVAGITGISREMSPEATFASEEQESVVTTA